MRLASDEVQAIKAAARDVFGAETVVRQFGGRVHHHLSGGDIDLHGKIGGEVPDFRVQARFLIALEASLDGRKVDLLSGRRGEPARGLEQIALRDGTAS